MEKLIDKIKERVKEIEKKRLEEIKKERLEEIKKERLEEIEKERLEEIEKEIEKESYVMGNGYFYDFRKNVFTGEMDNKYISMFLEGDGSELVSKACAPHSSSMLGYNFFHWINEEHKLTITFNDKKEITYDNVLFEVKIPVLNGKNKKEANMDIVLRNNKTGEWLFIESKFTEYLNRGKFEMSDSYRIESSYFKKDYGDKWTRIIDSISGSSKESGYWAGIKQEICHLIGLTNWLDKCVEIKDEEYNNEDVRFINLVFEPDEERFKNEYDKFTDYKKLYYDFYEQLRIEKLIPSNLKMEFMTYKQLWKCFEKCDELPEGLKDFLSNRYMCFAFKDK